MMDNLFEEQYRIVAENARRFAQKNIKPVAAQLDMEELKPFDIAKRAVRELFGGDSIQSVEELEKISEDRDILNASLITIELAKAAPAIVMAIGASLELCGATILSKGTEEQKASYALPLFRGEKVGCFGLTEPEAGSDVMGLKTKAVKSGDHYLLSGTKTFITNAPDADIFIVYARSNPQAQGHKGITAFILERGMPGLETSKPLNKMGLRGSPTGEIYMDEVKVPLKNIVGTEHRAFYELMSTLRIERTTLPSMAIGIMERVLDDSVKYAKQRVQFGQNIIFFEGIQFKIARMYLALQHSYAILFLLAQMYKAGKDITAIASAAKVYTSEEAVRVCLDAIQIHGGYGYMKEYEVERFMRDAKLLEIGAGTTEVQLLIMARSIMMEDQFYFNPMFTPEDKLDGSRLI
ncbi:MAG: acyl-CoA dehydrogenase family protein [Deltaproteobacteria bacterium]|nr:acyl-CoA dehydrogenase family protein [Deltaproteobacteria bacterium]MCL5276652.1 acyl-CoA dehydrogenase family protein [Deltaproteobacteria bacterium]